MTFFYLGRVWSREENGFTLGKIWIIFWMQPPTFVDICALSVFSNYSFISPGIESYNYK